MGAKLKKNTTKNIEPQINTKKTNKATFLKVKGAVESHLKEKLQQMKSE